MINSENRKYRILKNNTKTVNGIVVYQIQATKDFMDITEGTLGGHVSNESNLSQEGSCWLHPGCTAMGNSKVLDSAILNGSVVIQDYVRVTGHSYLSGNILLRDNVTADSACLTGSFLADGMIHLRGFKPTRTLSGFCPLDDIVVMPGFIFKGNNRMTWEQFKTASEKELRHWVSKPKHIGLFRDFVSAAINDLKPLRSAVQVNP